jgi:arylsulfatase A-like enzyme
MERRTVEEEEDPILDDPILDEPLNVIIFYPDDWRHDDLGDTNPVLNTPFFSRMARQGIRFTHNAVTTSICWISRGTLFTGQWVSRHASTYLFRPLFAREPERWKETWPSILQKFGGYWVGHVGKWQYQKAGYRNLFNYSDYFEGVMWYGKDHAAKRARNSAIKFLMDRPKDRPFAMTVAIYPPKGSSNPESAVPEYLAKYQNVTIPEPYDREAALKLLPTFLQDNKTDARIRYNYRFVDVNDYQTTMKTYLSVIEYIDKMCEEVIDEVHRQGIFNKTMIIVTADNGEFHANHALADKWYPYQESIRVPLIIYDPRMPKKKRGTLNNAFTLNVDLAETVLGAAGLRPGKTMQGRDISDLYLSTPKSTEPWRDEFFYEFPDINDKIPPSRAIVRHDWKYIEWTKHDHEELFNLEDDPFEFNDLAQDPQYAVLKKELKEKLSELRHEVMAPNIPGTLCDPLKRAGSDLSKFTNCSIEKPHLCCPGAAVNESLR